MRISVQSTVFLPTPAPGAGAVEYLVSKLCEGLAARGHAVTCYCLEGSTVNVNRQSVQMIGSTAAREGVIGRHISEEPPDVLFDHSLHQLAQRRLPDLPALTMSHGIAPISPWAHNIVFTSRHHGRLHGFNKPIALWNGVDVAEVPPSDPPAGKTSLLWLGRFIPYKRPHVALQIAQEAGVDLVMAGPIADQEYYQREVRPLLGDGRVHLGEVDHAAVMRLFYNCDALLFTSDETEPAGIVLLESQAAGRPVLAFALGATPEFLWPQGNRLVATPSQMVGAIKDSFWESFDGAAARAWVEQNRSMGAMVEQAENLLLATKDGERW